MGAPDFAFTPFFMILGSFRVFGLFWTIFDNFPGTSLMLIWILVIMIYQNREENVFLSWSFRRLPFLILQCGEVCRKSDGMKTFTVPNGFDTEGFNELA